MEAKYIYPEDIGLNEWSGEWAKLCIQFGYTMANIPGSLILVNIRATTSAGIEI